MRIIKKYPNRRLYDTELCLYITLDDIKKLVHKHLPFQIIDARTKKDLTQSTLLQIIAEEESSSTPIFTVELLQDLIRSYHEKSQDVFTQYLEQSMNLFRQQKTFLKDQWAAYQQLLKPETFQTAAKKQNKNQNARKKPNKNESKK
jgi:polyhydroxyalkanoate synthesis repressor PhaR